METEFAGLASEALVLVLLVMLPIAVPALVTGLVLGIVQAATSINEMTLSFVPKLVVVLGALALFGAAMLGMIADFTVGIFERIASLGA